KREPHFVVRQFLAGMGRRAWSHGGLRLFPGKPRCRKFLPEREVGGLLTCRIDRLERLQLALQLPQRKGQAQLRRDEQSLDEKNRAQKNRDTDQEQRETQAGPAFPGRVRKNKRRVRG